MTYYAVTNDPNELAHFGIKGMKWGVRRTDAQLGHPRHTGSKRPRSAAYKKAQSKLGKMMKSGIKKAEANWKIYNSPAAKEERFMKKAMQQARNGTLKYGKLNDAQVQRVMERLAMERNARALGNTENPSFIRRLARAGITGLVEGFGRGTASYIDARMKGRGETTAAIKKDKRMTKYASDSSIARQKAKNAANEEYYQEAAKRGVLGRRGYQKGVYSDAARAKKLQAWKENDSREAERAKRQAAYYDAYYKTFAVETSKNKVARKNELRANKYGYKVNSGNNNGNQNNGNGQSKPQLPVTLNIYAGNGKQVRIRCNNGHKRKGPKRGN